MATYTTYSQSLRLQSTDPITPLHSPHHSLHSSTSSRARTPLQPLTIHQYRKQQNSPAPQLATPPGKTLRRKAATPALNELERDSNLNFAPLSATRPPARSLHFSTSAQQLTYQSLPPSPPPCEHHALLGQPFRSQSAEPYGQLGLHLQQVTADKVRKFKPIKRLPKPPVATGFGLPSPLAITPTLSQHSLGYTSLLEDSTGSNIGQTPSTCSISQLPSPPFHDHDHEQAPPRQAVTANAPETPPATPAVIHYRGASFDLVNPHNSLCFANIVTPSRDLDSTDYLPLPTSDHSSVTDEMGPKKTLYGDLSSAHASIRAAHQNSTDLPSDKKFSIKQLTRTLTKKLVKSNEEVFKEGLGEELKDLSKTPTSPASPSFEGDFPRPLTVSYPESQAQTPRTGASAMTDQHDEAQRDVASFYASSSIYTESSRPHLNNNPDFLDSNQRNTDTINYFIDQYQHDNSSYRFESGSELSQFQFGDAQESGYSRQLDHVTASAEIGRADAPREDFGSVARPFEYDELLGSHDYLQSETTSAFSSYADTRQLLQISGPIVSDASRQNVAEPSSVYSQPEALSRSPVTQEALDQADEIFGNVASKEESEEAEIPAIWIRRGSGSLLRSRSGVDNNLELDHDDNQNAPNASPGIEGEDRDWETVRNSNQSRLIGRISPGDSIADYSSSEESDRDSMGFPSNNSLPVWMTPRINRRRDPSSPPPSNLPPNPSMMLSQGKSGTIIGTSSPQGSSPTPLARNSRGRSDTVIRTASPQDLQIVTPWVNRAQFSDKETEELLASGPNDNIIYDETRNEDQSSTSTVRGKTPTVCSPEMNSNPRNITTDMASRISPARLRTLSLSMNSRRNDVTPGEFYAIPGQNSSINRVRAGSLKSMLPSGSPTPSQTTLYPDKQLPQVKEKVEEVDVNPKYTPRATRRGSRSSVKNQTRLRQMMLLPGSNRSTLVQVANSDRPSTTQTTNTEAPLRPADISAEDSDTRAATPHLLCPERKLKPEEEKERAVKSWILFAAFCLFPPLLLLYRSTSDFIMVNMTDGRLTHAAKRPKKLAIVTAVLLSLTPPLVLGLCFAAQRI